MDGKEGSQRHPLQRLILLLGLLYGFLVAIGLMAGAFKILGQDKAGGLFEGVTNPLAALAVGIVGTVLVQSSSVTTSTIVAMCGAGQVSLAVAVYMIMGANIGTTITNTLVSVGSVRRTVEFRRAFACATVHDVFNFCAVVVLLPVEMATGVLRKSALALTDLLGRTSVEGSADFDSPIKTAVKAGTGLVQDGLGALGAEGVTLAVLLLIVAVASIFACLHAITKTMRALLVARIEASLNRVLGRSGLLAIAVGAAITVAVQSSSITTSLLVPLCAAGILTLENAFPITLGANIGTTVTALLASLAAESPAGLTIALVHMLFNIFGTAVFFPVPALRRLPPAGARWLARLAARNRLWILVYVVVVFVFLPLAGILLFS